MSLDGIVKTAAPTIFLLEVTNQPTLVELKCKADTIMKYQGSKVNLPLILIKVLICGN